LLAVKEDRGQWPRRRFAGSNRVNHRSEGRMA
jgi:hypothetical protein